LDGIVRYLPSPESKGIVSPPIQGSRCRRKYVERHPEM
jgi:hypothetical protein